MTTSDSADSATAPNAKVANARTEVLKLGHASTADDLTVEGATSAVQTASTQLSTA